MVAGRPPKQHTNEDLHEIGNDLLKWMKDNINNNEIMHLSEYCYQKDISEETWDLLRQRKEFHHYYKTALRWMGRKLMANKDLPTAYGSRFLAVYFADLREHEKQIQKEKGESEKTATENDPNKDRLITNLTNSLAFANTKISDLEKKINDSIPTPREEHSGIDSRL